MSDGPSEYQFSAEICAKVPAIVLAYLEGFLRWTMTEENGSGGSGVNTFVESKNPSGNPTAVVCECFDTSSSIFYVILQINLQINHFCINRCDWCSRTDQLPFRFRNRRNEILLIRRSAMPEGANAASIVLFGKQYRYLIDHHRRWRVTHFCLNFTFLIDTPVSRLFVCFSLFSSNQTIVPTTNRSKIETHVSHAWWK